MKRMTAAMMMAATVMFAAPAMAQHDATPKRAPGVTTERVMDLQVGDKAPELKISEWVKGKPVTGFENGHVYIVEFWATWCGPCIRGMPHVSELAEKYHDEGVTVIGVNIWDDPANVAPFMKERKNREGEVIENGDQLMQYTVAIEEKYKDENVRNGVMSKEWMAAAGRNGIPSAFIVDRKGYVAWMGHPMQMDKPLAEIVAGTWDIAKAAEDAAKGAKAEATANANRAKIAAAMKPYDEAMGKKDFEAAGKALAAALKNEAIWGDAMSLNSLAWRMVDPEAEIDHRAVDVALKAAKQASKLTDDKDPMILDTLAWAMYFAGDKAGALKTEIKAVDLASGELKAELEKALKRMKDGAGGA